MTTRSWLPVSVEMTYRNTWWVGCWSDATYPNKLVLVFFPPNTDNDVIIASPNAINDGQWHHGGWVYDPVAGDVTLYLDGAPVASEITSPDPFITNNPLCIGAYGTNCDTYEYVGSLDEIAAFKRALSASEVNDLFERGVVTLNLGVQACDDDSCIGENFINLGTESPQNVALSGRYFQYRYDFDSFLSGYTPELYRVAIEYNANITPDINGNGVVDGSDLAIFTASYGSSSGEGNFNSACDFDGNGSVDQMDLQTFAGQYGS